MHLQPDLFINLLFLFFVCIQLFYYFFFFIRLAIHKQNPVQHTPAFPVTLIICANNEEANLRKNLPGWLQQEYHRQGLPYYEVLVVDDNSEDDTRFLLNEFKEQYPHLRVLHLTQKAKLIPGKKFPLSMGIKDARYEHLLLSDADCSPVGTQWLAGMASALQPQTELVLGYSPYIKTKGWLNTWIRFETTHTAMQYFSYALAGMPYMGVGRNLAYVRSLFNRHKGFSTHHHLLSGDDDLFVNQAAHAGNTAVCLHPQTFTYSEPKTTFEAWLYQKKRHLSTGRHYKPLHKFLLGLYAGSHTAFWLTALAALFLSNHLLVFILPLFLLRMLVMTITWVQVLKKLEQQDLLLWLWILDPACLLYYFISLKNTFSRTDISWK